MRPCSGRNFPPEGIQVREQNFLLRHAFEVSPQHLLLPGDDPQLHGGFQLRVEVEERPDRRVMQERLEVLSGFIVSKHREERNTGSHGGDVTGNVRGAAETFLAACDAYDGHGGLRGNAVRIAKPVLIQHGVPDYEEPPIVKKFCQGNLR